MNESDSETTKSDELNADPITGAHFSHPMGTGLGALGAGVIGATIGMTAGPVASLAWERKPFGAASLMTA